jgi:hypothetical protein
MAGKALQTRSVPILAVTATGSLPGVTPDCAQIGMITRKIRPDDPRPRNDGTFGNA